MDIKLFYDALQCAEDKPSYLMSLRDDPITLNWDVRWDNLIAAWANDDWPMRRARKLPN